VLLLSGSPGVEKTTALTKMINALEEMGVNIGGILSPELREASMRVRIEIADVKSLR
jgi:nucleoside-triphosphatase THEP1